MLPISCRARLFCIALVLVGCQRQPNTSPKFVPPRVTVTYPVQKELVDYKNFTGRIEAMETVEVRTRVRGFLVRILFQEGSQVKKNELLYEIDPRTFEADVARAEAEVRRLAAELQLAISEADRATRLLKSGALTAEEHQQRITTRETTAAQLKQAEAVLANSQLELSFTNIYSPIDGRIGRTLVTVGNLVGYSEPTLLTTIVKLQPIYVYFEVPERDFLEYQTMMREEGIGGATDRTIPVYVGLDTEDGYPHQGVVDFRDSRVDSGTGTLEVRGELPNTNLMLIPGLYARVRVPIGRPRQHLLVPEEAVQVDQRGQYVLVVGADKRVEYRPVQTGATHDHLVVIEQGLKPGNQVVINGLQRARPGSTVEPLIASAKTSESDAAPGVERAR